MIKLAIHPKSFFIYSPEDSARGCRGYVEISHGVQNKKCGALFQAKCMTKNHIEYKFEIFEQSSRSSQFSLLKTVRMSETPLVLNYAQHATINGEQGAHLFT